MILRRKSSEYLESSIEINLGMWFAVWILDFAIHDFAFFNTVSSVTEYLAYFRDSAKQNFMVRDPLFFPFLKCARDTPVRPSWKTSASMQIIFLYFFSICSYTCSLMSILFKLSFYLWTSQLIHYHFLFQKLESESQEVIKRSQIRLTSIYLLLILINLIYFKLSHFTFKQNCTRMVVRNSHFIGMAFSYITNDLIN